MSSTFYFPMCAGYDNGQCRMKAGGAKGRLPPPPHFVALKSPLTQIERKKIIENELSNVRKPRECTRTSP